MKEGSWINVRGVDFGTDGAAKFTLRGKGTATLELRTARAGRPITTIEFSSTEMEEKTFEVDATKFKGVKSNFLLAVKSATDFYVDAWRFTTTTGIQKVSDNQHVTSNTKAYDLSGRRVDGKSNSKGIRIINGKKVVIN